MPHPEPAPRRLSLHLLDTDPVAALVTTQDRTDPAERAGTRLEASDSGVIVALDRGSLLWAVGAQAPVPPDERPPPGAPASAPVSAAVSATVSAPVSAAVFAAHDATPAAVDAMGRRIAAARRAGLLARGTTLLVVGDPPRPSEWGLRAVVVGSPVSLEGAEREGPSTPDDPESAVRRPFTTLVLGGAGSGKSGYAELLLAPETDVTYLATGRPPAGDDPEWDARVLAHRTRRPDWWATVDVTDPGDLPDLLARTPGHLLWDSVGTWLTATLDVCGAWHDASGWRGRVEVATSALLRAWSAGGGPRVAVAEEVGWGVIPATASGRLFQHELGRLNQRLAAASDAVRLVVAGRVTDLTKGMP